jgi:hypothetical protein
MPFREPIIDYVDSCDVELPEPIYRCPLDSEVRGLICDKAQPRAACHSDEECHNHDGTLHFGP